MHEPHAHESFRVEEEQPDNRHLFVYGVVIAATFFICGIVLTSVFHRATAAMLVKRGSQPGRELRELRADEAERLGGYAWVDKGKGVVRIPVDRAMELLVEEAQKR